MKFKFVIRRVDEVDHNDRLIPAEVMDKAIEEFFSRKGKGETIPVWSEAPSVQRLEEEEADKRNADMDFVEDSAPVVGAIVSLERDEKNVWAVIECSEEFKDCDAPTMCYLVSERPMKTEEGVRIQKVLTMRIRGCHFNHDDPSKEGMKMEVIVE